MTKPALIGPHIASTPAELKTASWRARALPEDLLRDASRRLGIMALLGAVLWVVATVTDHLALRSISGKWQALGPTDLISLVCALGSLALYAFVRWRPHADPRRILDLGLAYMVLTTFAISLEIHWDPVPRGYVVYPMITWVGAVILMFAAIVPNAPAKTLVASLIAVAMNPVSMLIARSRGSWDFGATSNVLLMHYPELILVGVAVVISHVVTRLGQQVARAREMGSYQLGELLGRGGMGEVYQATHRMLARPAAIKLIRPEILGGNGEAAAVVVKRFHREAKAAANLRSPHTVELYDFGVTDDGTLYFVMELLAGMDLETLVREHGPLPASRVIHILRQVCESLEEAHRAGLVHRDIKPANIHVGQLGLRRDFAKVLDFGLVKSVHGAERDLSMATAAGLTPGTPSYMAPEMAFGENVDARADIYAVGCVAYFLLTGKLVFEGEGALQTIMKHVRSQPVPPSQRTENPIPPALDEIVLACLAKDPAHRPQTAGALASSLAAVQVARWGEEDATSWWTTVGGRGAPSALTG